MNNLSNSSVSADYMHMGEGNIIVFQHHHHHHNASRKYNATTLSSVLRTHALRTKENFYDNFSYCDKILNPVSCFRFAFVHFLLLSIVLHNQTTRLLSGSVKHRISLTSNFGTINVS